MFIPKNQGLDDSSSVCRTAGLGERLGVPVADQIIGKRLQERCWEVLEHYYTCLSAGGA